MSHTSTSMPTKAPQQQTDTAAGVGVKRSPRERLLDAASELFYAEGVQSVGIDRVIERAGVAKASLYSTFGSKEALVEAYLDDRHERTLRRLRAAVAEVDDPVEKLLAVFDGQSAFFREPNFRGCAFSAARAEAPAGSRIDEAAKAYRHDVRALFQDLAAQAGVSDSDTLSRQLQMLYDGGGSAANLDRDPDVARAERAAAEALIRVALAA
jgi:AcrR family transcriptional regulator